MDTLTPRQRLDRLRAALRTSPDQQRQTLLAKLDACAEDWSGRYRCRVPSCPTCRGKNIRKQQQEIRSLYEGAENEDFAFVSIVLPGTRHVEEIGPLLRKGQEALRKRIAAARGSSPSWDDVCISGWFEVDAVGADHFQLLPSERKALLAQIAPLDDGQISPTWLPTIHAIAYLGGLDVGLFREQLARQWQLLNQVDVVAFDAAQSVETNLEALTCYSNKFACELSLSGHWAEPWPAEWEAELATWLNSGSRSSFEFLRFSVRQKSLDSVEDASVADENVREPMPFTCSFSRLPMPI